jgi:hypothetical protein
MKALLIPLFLLLVATGGVYADTCAIITIEGDTVVNTVPVSCGYTSPDPADPQSPTPDPVNLTLDFDILDPIMMDEWYAGQDILYANQQVRLNVQLEAEQGDVKDWMDPGNDTIETDFYVRYDDGDWFKLGRQYTNENHLDEGETHTEHMLLTIPQGVSEASFYVKTDAEKELTETDEGDNVSRIETFEVEVAGATQPTQLTPAQIMSIILPIILED